MTVLLSWSSGKDSAWALHALRTEGWEVAALLTTLNQAENRVSMQGVRRDLLLRQGEETGLEVWEVPLPWPCPNEVYERAMAAVMARAVEVGITHVAFGDLYLEDVRGYREEMLAGSGVEPLFPIWCGDEDTASLADRMRSAGLEAVITCVDPNLVDPAIVGHRWEEVVDTLPGDVDPLGELGEFHTFCHAAPVFRRPIPVQRGAVVQRAGFWWADLFEPVSPDAGQERENRS